MQCARYCMMRMPIPSDPLRWLVDRALISDVVVRFAIALDTRDWPLLRSCLAARVEVDYPDSVTPENLDEVIVHDAHADDPTTAFAMSRLTDSGYLHRAPIGIFRQVQRSTYDDRAREQVATASEGTGDPTAALAGLLGGGDTWTVV